MQPFHLYSLLSGTVPADGCDARGVVIGITGNFDEGQLKLLPGYFRSIEQAGGIPLVIPPRGQVSDEVIVQLLERIDGLLLSGGADVNPLWAGEEPLPQLHGINPVRDAFELKLASEAYHRQVPMLGICRGIQVLAMALGGSIHQDLHAALPDTRLVKHSQDAPRGEATHSVTAEQGSVVEQLLGRTFAVNSFHHQAVNEPGPHLRVTARAADGVVEAVESTELKSIVGVQWHPECFAIEGDASMMPLFKHLVNEARSFAEARRVHRSIVTLDSHCDTPMWFHHPINLAERCDKVLVDFTKMREGHLDASSMVAYLPQGERTPQALQAATAEAHRLIDDITRRVKAAPGVALATTPDEVLLHKRQGLLSVMPGIENGYALGRDVQNVARFRAKGVVYITLCHLGRRVVAEMNRTGVMVDMSHAAESSFYQAIEASQVPIVCSHASSRALCNHPRNLTDDQLRALAAAGGVAQVTLYHGFLKLDETEAPADIRDAVRHLMHMIDVAGIDHVGIGTDFDGDGGIVGCANASELIQFTRRLLAEGLTHDDLQKVWGGNFLRVMRQVQQQALQ